MFALASLCLGLAQSPAALITRDSYGVPVIRAESAADAWRAAGYACAQDRLWQMELSRRLAEGRMAEILGSSYVGSDTEVLKVGYTEEELMRQVSALSPELQERFKDYADGVNAFIAEGKLPEEFAASQDECQPWRVVDSAAIAVRLFQYFGRGGAGQLRNMAALGYLSGRKELNGKVLDVLDDLLWQNDPSSPTTVLKEDESGPRPAFATFTRSVTEKHLAMLPKLGLFDILPGLALAMKQESTRVAQSMATPFRTGSYCMVVSAKRSGTGLPILLSGPQMGFTSPSIVHEMCVSAPGITQVGMDVPGVPGVVIGHNRHLAWGLTSGVAATDDIVYYKKSGDGDYLYGPQTRPVSMVSRVLHVKGAADQTIVQKRTEEGPVILDTKSGFLFARHASYSMHELQSLEAVCGLEDANTVEEADKAASLGTMSFNVFFAADNGHIGYRYAGLVPLRADGIDPRFPTPGDPAFAWRGMIPLGQMPHVLDPKGGLITNWNNKPVSWWPNLDTPAWGKLFRVSQIRDVLSKPTLIAQDLEFAAWSVARTDETWVGFGPFVSEAVATLRASHSEGDSLVGQSVAGFDGRFLEGSRQAAVYKAFLVELRKALFLPNVGNFMAPQYLDQALQPSVMLAALQGKTKFDYLHGRKASDVVLAALTSAYKSVGGAGYHAPSINVPGEDPIPYSNRGTYIQIVEMLLDGPKGRNVLPPGVAESGPHSKDQADLSRAWVYKPMHRPWAP